MDTVGCHPSNKTIIRGNKVRYNRIIPYGIRKYCGVRARGPRAAIADTMCGLGNTTRRVRCAWAVVEIASPKARVLTL